MRRRLFTAAAAISLGAALLSGVLWVRSYRGPSMRDRDRLTFTHEDPRYWIICDRGRAVLCRQMGRDWDEDELPGFDVLGLSFGGSRGGNGSMLWNLAVPFWLIVTLALVLPLARTEVWRRDARRARRTDGGLCPRCGYDVRASPDRCPECGTASLNQTARG